MANMNLSNFNLLKEDDDNYHVKHPSGKTMAVAKKSLSPKAHEMIKKMCSGGDVQKFAGDKDDPSASVVQPDLSHVGDNYRYQPPSSPEMNLVGMGGGDSGPGFMDSLANSPVNLAYVDPQAQASPSSQAPAAPVQAPAVAAAANTPNPAPSTGSAPSISPNPGIEKALQEQQAANKEEAKQIGGQGAKEQSAIDDMQSAINALPTQQDIIAKDKVNDDKLFDAYQNQHMDPKRYMHDLSTPNKVIAGISAFLGGMSTPFTHQGNPALQVMENAINRDMESQKADINQKHTLWSMNRERLGNNLAADMATKNQMYMGLKAQLASAASQFKGPLAMAKAQQANALIDQQIAMNRYHMSFMQGPTKESATDPNYPEKVVANSGLFQTPEEQKQALDEIAYRKNLKAIAQPSLDAFDKIGFHRIGDLNPMQDTPEQQAFQGLANTTVKEQEGTARAAAFKSMKENFMPQLGDSNDRRAAKRAAYVQYLQAKQAAPFNASRGNNLDNFESTTWHPSSSPVGNNAQQQKIQVFMKQNPSIKDPNQARDILQKAGKF